jgi:hypothetical protein
MTMARKPTEEKLLKDGDLTGGKVTPPPALGHNQLSDADKQALFFSWKKQYVAALAKKKAADAELKNVAKKAKAELGDDAVDSIKDAIALESEDGEAIIKAAIERQLRVARWMAVPFGSQGDMFGEPDRTPGVDRAFAEGRRDGLDGKTLNNPYASDLPQSERYATGWHDGQKAIFNIKAPVEDGDLRPRFMKNGGGEAAAGA